MHLSMVEQKFKWIPRSAQDDRLREFYWFEITLWHNDTE